MVSMTIQEVGCESILSCVYNKLKFASFGSLRRKLWCFEVEVVLCLCGQASIAPLRFMEAS